MNDPYADPLHGLHPEMRRHRARCTVCGWVGPVRLTFRSAEADAQNHHNSKHKELDAVLSRARKAAQ